MWLSARCTNAKWLLGFLREVWGRKTGREGVPLVNCKTRIPDCRFTAIHPTTFLAVFFSLCLCVWVLAININETFFSWPDSQRKGEEETIWYSGSSLTFCLFESFWYKWNSESGMDGAYETGPCIVCPVEISGESKTAYDSCCACTLLMRGSRVGGTVVIVQFIINRIWFAWLPFSSKGLTISAKTVKYLWSLIEL